MNRILTVVVAAAAALALAGSVSSAGPTRSQLLVQIRGRQDTPALRAALFGRIAHVKGRAGGAHIYRIVLKPGTSVSAATDRLLAHPAVVSALPPGPRVPAPPQRMASVSALGKWHRSLMAQQAASAGPDGPPRKVGGLGYLRAYEDYIRMRAYPNRTVDWMRLRAAQVHRDRMRPAVARGKGSGLQFMGQDTWEYIGPRNLDVPYSIYWGPRPVSGRVNALAYDPQNVGTYYLAGSTGGLWKTTDFGVNWIPLGDKWPVLPCSSIALDPRNTQVIYVGTGDYHGWGGYATGVMRSTDGGATWTNVGNAEFGAASVSSVMLDPENPDVVLAATGRGPGNGGYVWRSADRGDTWTRVISTAGHWSALKYGALSGGSRRCYATDEFTGQVWRSDDRGQTWAAVPSPVGAGQYGLDIAPSLTNPDVVYLVASTDQLIFKSTNAGAAWTDITGSFPGGYNWSQYWYDFHINTSTRKDASGNPVDVVYVGLIDIVQSDDAGGSWRSVGGPTYSWSALTHNDQHCLAVNPADPNEVLIGNDGGVYRLKYEPDQGAWTITSLNTNLGITQFYRADWHPTDLNWALGGTQDNASPVALGDLANWECVAGGDGGGSAINPINPLYQYATVYGCTVIRTADGWQNSYDISPDTGGDNSPFVTPISVDPNDGTLYAGTNYLYRWSESTQTWASRLGNQVLTSGGVVTSIVVAPGQSSRIYVCTSTGGLWMTTDKGQTWAGIQNGSPALPDRAVTSVAVNPEDPSDVVVGLSGSGTAHVWRCADTTAPTRKWENVSGTGLSGLPDIPVNALAIDPANPSYWYAGTDVGVFSTSDSGATWANATAPLGLPNVQITELKVVPGTRMLNAATYGRGMWRLQLTPARLAAVMVDPNPVVGNSTATGTVKLDGGAPSGSGAVVRLSSSNPAIASVPAAVTIAPRAQAADFAVTTGTVTGPTPVNITASYQGIDLVYELTVEPLGLAAIAVQPTSTKGGRIVQGTATLNGPAPAAGAQVQLRSSDPAAVPPASVTVSPGLTAATFDIATVDVPSARTVTITGEYERERTAELTVLPSVILTGMTFQANPAQANSFSVGTLTIDAPAPLKGPSVTLTSSNPAVAKPATPVYFTPGQRTRQFSVITGSVMQKTDVDITAVYRGMNLKATLTVIPPVLASFSATPTLTPANRPVKFTVSLSGPAPVGGGVIRLTSTHPCVPVPVQVVIPAKTNATSFTVYTRPVSATTTATIRATFGSTSKSVSVTVQR